MALIAVAADKGAPGVTTTATALAAVWPRPVVLAECDPAGGDIVYRLPGAHGGRLDPRRGLLSLAVAARHGLEPGQVWAHAQRLRGGLDVLAGVTNAEQGSGIEPLWGPVGHLLAGLPGADVIADCGRLGPDGPYYELLAQAALVVLIIRPHLGEVVRLRDRVAAVAIAAGRRGGREARIAVLVIADRRGYRRSLAEVRHAVGGANSPVGLVAGIAHEPKSARRLRGEWSGRLDRSLLIRTARDAAAQLTGDWLPGAGQPGAGQRRAGQPGAGQPGAQPASTGPVRAGAPGAGRVPGAGRLADAGRGSGPRPAGTARSAGLASPAGPPGPPRPADPIRVNGHGRHTATGAQETRAWAPSAREPAADLNAARLAADQLSAAGLTAAQAATARLSAAQAAGDRRGARRGLGRTAGRGRHAGGPAQPAAGSDAAGPGAGRARPQGW